MLMKVMLIKKHDMILGLCLNQTEMYLVEPVACQEFVKYQIMSEINRILA